jgi:imidazole glycerol phosphate synthase subunit HisF
VNLAPHNGSVNLSQLRTETFPTFTYATSASLKITEESQAREDWLAAACARVLALGARFVVMGTVAIKTRPWSRKPAPAIPSVVVAVDAREGKVAVEGWKEDTTSDALEIGQQMAAAGAAAVLYADIGRDGMRTGPNLDATA